MCGIAGFVLTGNLRDAERRLRAMAESVRHRGPDGEGAAVFDHAGLAHTRLSIIDLSAGAQPMSNDDGSVTITFNGEIFNYVELRQELTAARKGAPTTNV